MACDVCKYKLVGHTNLPCVMCIVAGNKHNMFIHEEANDTGDFREPELFTRCSADDEHRSYCKLFISNSDGDCRFFNDDMQDSNNTYHLCKCPVNTSGVSV